MSFFVEPAMADFVGWDLGYDGESLVSYDDVKRPFNMVTHFLTGYISKTA